MITSSASLAADDLSIRCRVRRSQYAHNPQFGEAQEMTCTMRHWEQTHGSSPAGGGTKGGAAAAAVTPQTPPALANEDGGGAKHQSSAERLRRSSGSGRRSDAVAAVTALLGNSNGADPTRGRELLLCPVHLPHSSSAASFGAFNSGGGGDRGSEGDGGRARSAAAGVLSQRFHSFGSTPGVTHLPDHSMGGGRRGGFADADSDPGIAAGSSASSVPGRSPARLRGGMGATMRRDRVMSDGNLAPLGDASSSGGPRRHGSVHSSGTSTSASARSRSAGKRTPSLPRIRPSAAAAFAVGGLGGVGVGVASAEKFEAFRHDLTALRSYRVALSDVIVVDVDGIYSHDVRDDFCAREGCRMNVTTASEGYFEFVFQSKNAHDVLLAFLQASLPPERITHGAGAAAAASADGGRGSPRGVNSLTDSDRLIQIKSSGCCDTTQGSYDMEGFTAREMKERVKREGLGGKIRRRFVHIVNQLQDVSLSLSECFCSGGPEDLSDDEGRKPMAAAARSMAVGSSSMPVAPQTPTYHHEAGAAPQARHRPRSERRHPPAIYTTPRKQGTIDHKFSMENTPLAQQHQTPMTETTTTHATAEARGPKRHFRHMSFEASTPGIGQPPPPQQPQLGVYSSAGDAALASAPPLIPDMISGSKDGSSGPITPVGTSESEDDSKEDEDAGELEGGAKLQTVDI